MSIQSKPNSSFADWANETIDQTRERLRRPWGDYLLTILIINPINLRLVRKLGRTSITPNQLTIFSFSLMIVSACLLTSINGAIQAAGGGFLLIAYQIDCLDGDLARLKSLKSPLGSMLDPILDRLGELAITIGVSINGWRLTGDAIWLIGGIILAGMSQLYCYVNSLMTDKSIEGSNPQSLLYNLTLRGTRVRFGCIEPHRWGQTILAFAGIAHWGIPIFGFMFTLGNLIQIFRIVLRTRNIEGNKPKYIQPT